MSDETTEQLERCHAPNPRGGYAHCIRHSGHTERHLAASGDSWPDDAEES